MQEYYLVVAYVMSALLGLCVGSFLNVVIYRLPNSMSLAKPASHCTSCGYVLRWYDNIPVLSYITLGGKCRKCKSHISIRYTLVEIANTLFWVLSVALFWKSSPVYAAISALSSTLLICVFFIDLEHMIIFNRFSVMLALLGVAAAFFDGGTRPLDHVIGGAAGGLLFLGLYYGALLILKKEGLGFGDVKLVAAAGLLLGWQKLILALLAASLVGSVVLLSLRALRKDERDAEYPFGPFLVFGIVFSMFIGTPLINAYVAFLTF